LVGGRVPPSRISSEGVGVNALRHLNCDWEGGVEVGRKTLRLAFRAREGGSWAEEALRLEQARGGEHESPRLKLPAISHSIFDVGWGLVIGCTPCKRPPSCVSSIKQGSKGLSLGGNTLRLFDMGRRGEHWAQMAQHFSLLQGRVKEGVPSLLIS
jgi:hypothetical protein